MSKKYNEMSAVLDQAEAILIIEFTHYSEEFARNFMRHMDYSPAQAAQALATTRNNLSTLLAHGRIEHTSQPLIDLVAQIHNERLFKLSKVVAPEYIDQVLLNYQIQRCRNLRSLEDIYP